jgi:hypothetical protein
MKWTSAGGHRHRRSDRSVEIERQALSKRNDAGSRDRLHLIEPASFRRNQLS